MAGYYLPSFKGGGPIQSIRNLVDNFGEKIDFYILAADRDLDDKKPFSNVVVDEWIRVEKALVYYTDTRILNWRKLKTIIKNIDFDIIYLNSFFAFKDSMIPIFLHKINSISTSRIILAPRGQFSKGALGLKSWKKKSFVAIAKFLKLYKNIDWHATTEIEKRDIESIFGYRTRVHVANNLTLNYEKYKFDKTLSKQQGEIKLVYIARIHPMKNLLQTLKILQKIEGKVKFSIYGPIEDKAYWDKCQNEISKLNENIEANYFGLIANDKVNEIYQEHHVAILMTLGENFGHSITEALIGGCPVIISDRTPWRNLVEFNVGYDIPLDNDGDIVSAISHYIEMDNLNYEVSSKKAFDYAKTKSNTDENINSYLKMFEIRK
jgi:glycosyltransferase involved in cell wall biosynthesis